MKQLFLILTNNLISIVHNGKFTLPRSFQFICILTLLVTTPLSCAHRIEKSGGLPVISLRDLLMPSDGEFKSRTPAATSLTTQSYLGIDLELTPFSALLKHIEKIEKIELTSRDEAHITVITPPEMKILNNKLKPQQIRELADELDLENAPYQALCVGRAQVAQDRTYFVVVSSEKIFHFRSQLAKLFQKNGGSPAQFKAENYFPHVTLGFNSRDLHEQDGVIKDERTCFYVFDEETEDLLSSKSAN